MALKIINSTCQNKQNTNKEKQGTTRKVLLNELEEIQASYLETESTKFDEEDETDADCDEYWECSESEVSISLSMIMLIMIILIRRGEEQQTDWRDIIDMCFFKRILFK